MEMPDKRDSVAAGEFRVSEPGAPVPDTQAVHLQRRIKLSNALDVVAKAFQQLRQVRVVGGLYLRGRIVPVRAVSHVWMP